MKTIKIIIVMLMALNTMAQTPKEQFNWSLTGLESFPPFVQSISYNSTVMFLNIQKNGFFKIQNQYDIVSGVGLYNSTDSIDIMGIRYGKTNDTLYAQSVRNRNQLYYFNLNKSFLTDSLVKKNSNLSQNANILPLGSIIKVKKTEVFWDTKTFNTGSNVLKNILKKDKYYILSEHSVIEMLEPLQAKKVLIQKSDFFFTAFDISADGKFLVSYEKDKKFYVSLYFDTELIYNQEVTEPVLDIAFIREGEYFVSLKKSVLLLKFQGYKDVVFSESYFPENQPINTFMGRISVVRSDPTFKYSFILLDSPNFILKGDSLISNKVFDYESQKLYQLRIIARSDKDVFETKLNVFISDVFEQIKPVFVTNELTSGTLNIDYSIVIKASDANGDKLVFSSKYLPVWMKISDKGDGTASLTGKPVKAGTDSVVISLTDGIDRIEKKYILSIIDKSGIQDINTAIKCYISDGFLHIESSREGTLELLNLLGQKEFEVRFSQYAEIPIPFKLNGLYIIKIQIHKYYVFKKIYL